VQNNDTLIGRDLDGYLIEELLGHGGMGRVYRGLDAKLNRYAAIKILDVQSHKPREYEQRFYREAQAIAKLRHQNIVSIYRFNDVNNIFYMAMEYIDGADLRWLLRDYFAEDQLMDYDTILAIIKQIALALDYSHKNGVIHRDIKPPNIMIARDGKAILTDFGLALDVTEGSVGEIFGSPHYIAPEQAINSADAVPQTDIYSLGVILYEMLAGSLPFTNGSIIEIAMAHIHETPPDPRSINPELNEIFIPILGRVLEKDPKNRYQSGAALVKDLKKAILTIEKTQPALVFSTLSNPVERIAQNISLLPIPILHEDTKLPTRMADSKATIELENERHASVNIIETPEQKAKAKPRRPSPLMAILLILLIIGFGIGGLYHLAPETLNRYLPESIVFSPQETNAVIEGRILSIDDRSKTLMIYDLVVQIDENHPLWIEAKLNDVVYIEGQVAETEDVLHFEQIKVAMLNGKAVGGIEGQ
jgi:serine/threonine protein kinase